MPPGTKPAIEFYEVWGSDCFSIRQDAECVGFINNATKGKFKLFIYNGWIDNHIGTFDSLDACKATALKHLMPKEGK